MIAPGIYPDLDEAAYRADPALGSTDVKRLLSAPALYRWHRDNPEPHADHFDVGSALHSVLLGGRDIGQVDAPDWRSASARTERERIREAGGIPLLVKDAEAAEAMARSVLASTDLLDAAEYEVSLFGELRGDLEGVPVKARIDAWHRGRAVVDLKTTTDASPDAIRRAILRYGYHVQAAHYAELAGQVEGGTHDSYLIFVEKQPPHLVTAVVLEEPWLNLGWRRCIDAYESYRACTTTGEWPGYAAGVLVLDMPPWADRTPDLEVI